MKEARLYMCAYTDQDSESFTNSAYKHICVETTFMHKCEYIYNVLHYTYQTN